MAWSSPWKVSRPKKGNEPTRTEIRLTDKTKVAYYGVEGVGQADGRLPGHGPAGRRLHRHRPARGVAQEGPHLTGKVVEVSADGKRFTLEVSPQE